MVPDAAVSAEYVVIVSNSQARNASVVLHSSSLPSPGSPMLLNLPQQSLSLSSLPLGQGFFT